MGKCGALLGLAAALLLTVGGVGAAVAIRPGSPPTPAAQPQTRVITVLDESPTTTTTPPPPPSPATAPAGQVSGSGAATITVIIKR